MTFENDLLHSLGVEDLEAVRARGKVIECSQLEVLQRPEQRIGHVYFPQSGWMSQVAILENGRSAEVGVIGREGIVGLEILLGGALSSFEWLVQGPGTFLRVPVADFREMLAARPQVGIALSRYALVFYDQVAQTAACNASHTVDQRLARWLLLSHDRGRGDTMALTQELLAMMLGVRRAGIAVSAGLLKSRGHIDYSRGSVTVRDRAGLEAAACECYRAVRRRCEALQRS